MKEGLKTVVIAVLLALLLFTIGFILGEAYGKWKVSAITDNYNQALTQMKSIRLEEQFLELHGSCEATMLGIQRLGQKLDILGEELEAYERARDFGSRFNSLKNDYILLELETWMMISKSECKNKPVTILYFYKKDCDLCEQESIMLSKIKERFGPNVMIFSIDQDSPLEIVGLLESYYNITSSPMLVIGDKAYGYLNESEIENKVLKSA